MPLHCAYCVIRAARRASLGAGHSCVCVACCTQWGVPRPPPSLAPAAKAKKVPPSPLRLRGLRSTPCRCRASPSFPFVVTGTDKTSQAHSLLLPLVRLGRPLLPLNKLRSSPVLRFSRAHASAPFAVRSSLSAGGLLPPPPCFCCPCRDLEDERLGRLNSRGPRCLTGEGPPVAAAWRRRRAGHGGCAASAAAGRRLYLCRCSNFAGLVEALEQCGGRWHSLPAAAGTAVRMGALGGRQQAPAAAGYVHRRQQQHAMCGFRLPDRNRAARLALPGAWAVAADRLGVARKR